MSELIGRILGRTSDEDHEASAVDDGSRHFGYQVASFSAIGNRMALRDGGEEGCVLEMVAA